jgi:hypothetical protein
MAGARRGRLGLTVITLKPVYDEVPGQEPRIPLMATGGAIGRGVLSLTDDLAEDAFFGFRFDTRPRSEVRQDGTKRGRKPSRRRKD